MEISIFSALNLVAIFIPLFFGLYLFISRLNLTFVDKKVLNNGLNVINLISFAIFTSSYFLTSDKEILNLNYIFFKINEISLNFGLLIDKNNLLFLMFSSFILTVISFYLKKYFNKKKQFIFTKQRFFIYLSFLSFLVNIFFVSPNLFQATTCLILQSALILIFSYIDIFKNGANFSALRFHRITHLGNFSLLITSLILFKYAVFSLDFIKSTSTEYFELESLINYTYGTSSVFEFSLMSICFILAIMSRLTIFPLNCYYSFFANSSSVFYLTVSTLANSLIGFYLFLKAAPIFEIYNDYILYFEILVGAGILFSLFQLLFEQNIKIIFGYLISIMNSIFVILFFNFNQEIILYSYFVSSFILALILMFLFYKNKNNISKRLINKQFGFALEKSQIIIFETIPHKVANIFELFYEKIIQNIIPFLIEVFYLFVSFLNIKTTKTKPIRNILIIFALIILFAIYIVLFGGLN